MTQQQISTPSVSHIEDSKILSSVGYPILGINANDPWDSVLTALEPKALDPSTVVAGMDNAIAPSSINPFTTRSFLALKLKGRGLILVGPTGSNADYEGTTDGVFTSAIASLPPEGGTIAVLAGVYNFSSTVVLPNNVCLIGVHPLLVSIQGQGDFPLFELAGEKSSLKYLTLENSFALSYPVATLTGISTLVFGCQVSNYPLLGIQLVGSKACVKSCLITSATSGIWLQGFYQCIENCSFSGSLLNGALRFESSMCSALFNFIQDSVTGASYNIPSISCANNKLVANHFGTLTALGAAVDLGTQTVKYANTPNVAAENNLLIFLQQYTGQPLLTSTQMILTNDFAHVTDDATSILSSFDIFIKRTYEERSWFLTSSNPSFDSVGSPLSGVFSWNGTVLSWPDFAISSLAPTNTWTIAASLIAVAAGEAVVLNIDRTTPGVIIPVVQSLKLTLQYSTANQFVLAFSPTAGVLVWTKGFRLLTALTSFDVDGVPLPINRFIGMPTDFRNTPQLPTGFAIGDNVTTKLSSESSLLQSLFEKTNLWEYSDSAVDSFPKLGSWLSLTSGIPSAPSHLLQMKGSTYGLFPTNGVYRWYRATAGNNPGMWGVLVSNPAGAGPFASMSYLGAGSLAVLTCSGSIVVWNADTLSWSTISPTISISSSFPFPSSRSVSYDSGGQCDYAVQTPYYTLFTLLDGRTLLYFQTLNLLVESYRVFTESPKAASFLGRHLKDSGFNASRTNWIDNGDNGAYSTLQGLPLYSQISGPFEIPPQVYVSTLAAVQWDTLTHESFSYDPSSNAFIEVASNGSTIFYILNNFKLLSVVTIGTSAGFTDFTPHGWLTNAANGEVIAFGATVSTSAFTVVMGTVVTGGSQGSSPFTWTRSVLGVPNSSKGAVGVIDRWDNQGTNDIHILASDLSRSSRPTWWRYSRASSTWSSATLADIGGSVTVAQAVASSFTYTAATDKMASYGVAALSSIYFLVRDAARGNRPTLFAYNYSTSTYSGIRLSEGVAPLDVTVAGADVNSMTQVYGGVYQKALQAIIWVSASITNQIKLIFYFIQGNLWQTMSVGSGGTYLPALSLGSPSFLKRTGSLASIPTLTPFIAGITTSNIFVWTQSAGLLRGSLTGYYLTGIASAVWTQDKKQPSPLPVFSSTPMSTYSPQLAVSRCDLSIQIASIAEKTLPIYGVGTSATTGSIQWFQPGTKVKQITSTIWAGLNRGGYLWIANPSFSNSQQELTPNPATIRGDITVANLGYTTDYDWAFNGSGSQIAFVYQDLANFSRLAFILYDIASNSIIHERGGLYLTIAIGSTPKIAYNPVNNSWSIVAQDGNATPSLAGLNFYRRLVISSTWFEEDSKLSPGSGQNPAKPMHYSDGSTLVVTQTSTSNALLSMRTLSSGAWSSVYQTAGGGFKSPQFIMSLDGLMYWIFGGVDSTANIAWSTNVLSGWALWSGSSSLSSIGYSRVSIPTPLALTSSIVVASSATVDGATPASRELLIWKFDNSGSVKVVGAFTSKGRLQSSIYSGEEEDGITDLSWTLDQKLLYGATRPTRTTMHWSLRGSTQAWNVPHGDSLLGSGRFITLGEKHLREQWGSKVNTGGGALGTDLIIEYPSLTTWPVLPLAQRTSESDYTSLQWPFATYSGSLFTYGSPSSGITNDATLPTGSLVTSASRGWPLIMGNTRWSGTSHTGASVFSQGAMLGLFPPASSTNLAYFGNATIGSNNLFKLQALAAVTFNGTRTWSVSPSKQYVLVGPVTYQIDTSAGALGAHLALVFNTASSLVLDPTSTLSYWTSTNYSNSTYAVVIGEVQDQSLLLFPATGSRGAKLLTFGHLEPIEINTIPLGEWIYSIPYKLDKIPLWQIIGTGATSFALQEVGSLRGIQSTTFTSGVLNQLLLRRLLPFNGSYLYQTNGVGVVTSSSNIASLATLTSTFVIFDKLAGEFS
jgi:hypothetical protein